MKKALRLSLVIALAVTWQGTVLASTWSEREGYWGKTGGKFLFGLRHALFSWTTPWAESQNPKYKTEWEGFCVGIGKIVPFTAGGLIHLATFPIPVDFPDMGKGLHSPHKRHYVGFAERGAPPEEPAPVAEQKA